MKCQFFEENVTLVEKCNDYRNVKVVKRDFCEKAFTIGHVERILPQNCQMFLKSPEFGQRTKSHFCKEFSVELFLIGFSWQVDIFLEETRKTKIKR